MPSPNKHIPELPEEFIHKGTTHRKRLIRVDDHKKGDIATFNYAWLEPGKELDLHAHPDGEEYYVFLEGQGQMRVGKDSFPVSPMDFVTIPEHAEHSLKNTGQENLVFLTIRTVYSKK